MHLNNINTTMLKLLLTHWYNLLTYCKNSSVLESYSKLFCQLYQFIKDLTNRLDLVIITHETDVEQIGSEIFINSMVAHTRDMQFGI